MLDAGVHCRIGSSETHDGQQGDFTVVQCRIGSSEIYVPGAHGVAAVHCRIGSSENVGKLFLILDSLRVHHAKPVKAWLAEHADAIEIF